MPGAALGLEPRRTRWPLAAAVVGIGADRRRVARLLADARRRHRVKPVRRHGRLVRIDPGEEHGGRTDPGRQRPERGRRRRPRGLGREPRGRHRLAYRSGHEPRVAEDVRPRQADRARAHRLRATSSSNGPQDANITVIDGATRARGERHQPRQRRVLPGCRAVGAGESGVWLGGADRRVSRLDVITSGVRAAALHRAARRRRLQRVLLERGRRGRRRLGRSAIPSTTGCGASTPATGKARRDRRASLRTEGRRRRRTAASGSRASSTTRCRASTRDRTGHDTDAGRSRRVRRRGRPRLRLGREHGRRHGLPDRPGTGRGHRRRSTSTATRWTSRSENDAVWVARRKSRTPRAAATSGRTIGLITVCEGAYGLTSEPSIAGAELPLLRRGARLAGPGPRTGSRRQPSRAGRSGSSWVAVTRPGETALSETRRLVEQRRRRRPDRPELHRRGARDQGVRASAARSDVRRDLAWRRR